MESNTVLLLGIGETGQDVVRIIVQNETKGIAVFGIKNESEPEQLTANVFKEVELVLLVADLGNKEENSLALQVSRIAKEQGKVSIAILTIPRLFEGEEAIMRAVETAQEIGKISDSLLVINKETFNTVPEEGCSFAELISSLVPVEETIADCIQNMMTLISKEGEIIIDVHDLKTVLAESGAFIIESGMGAGEDRVGTAIEQVLSSPLMKACDISTAQRVLIKFLAPKATPLIMDEMKAVTGFVKTLPSHADVKWGIGESDDDDILSVIVLASAFDVKLPK